MGTPEFNNAGKQALGQDELTMSLKGEVLSELFKIAIGEDEVEGWAPPVLCCGAELRQPL
jgi:hypothetical protein